jgi:hypothetical protein
VAVNPDQGGDVRVVTAAVGDRWEVRAEWFGADRVVFSGSVFACLRFVRDN